MRLTITLAAVLAAVGLVGAADPSPSLDALAAKVAEARAKQADAQKQIEDGKKALEDAKRGEEAARAELRAALEKLGLIGPGPVPPPKPPDPPSDPLRAKLKAAYDADGSPIELKREQARDLAALYRAAAKLADDPAVATSGELLRRVRDAAGTMVGPDVLREVRRSASGELAALLPTDAALTNEQRASSSGLFRKLGALLEDIAK